MDSTCFFDIPSTTSFTFAFVSVFEELQAENANASSAIRQRGQMRRMSFVTE
jgi:hypothetical protein